jgi:hypothetical protein
MNIAAEPASNGERRHIISDTARDGAFDRIGYPQRDLSAAKPRYGASQTNAAFETTSVGSSFSPSSD